MVLRTLRTTKKILRTFPGWGPLIPRMFGEPSRSGWRRSWRSRPQTGRWQLHCMGDASVHLLGTPRCDAETYDP